MKKSTKITLYCALSSVSFIVFFYFSFPYTVLKEVISSEISSALDMNLTMDDLSPLIPLGFELSDVKIGSVTGESAATFKTASVRLSIWSLFFGNIGVTVKLKDGQNGSLKAFVSYPLFGGGNQIIPSEIEVAAKNFGLEELISVGLKKAASSESINPLLAPVLSGVGVSGKLTGTINASINTSAPQKSTGDVDIKIDNAKVLLSSPSIGLPDQVFKQSRLLAQVKSGVLQIDPLSKFASDELEFGTSGKVTLRNPIERSELDVAFRVKLGGELREKFGFLLGGLTGSPSTGGEIQMKFSGTIKDPSKAM